MGTSQPLVTTGHAQAGVIVFATLLDERHIRLGADVWGALYSSEPIAIDYSKVHTLVVSDSALFPLAHPAVAQLPPQEAKRLRHELRVELDGSLAIEADCYAYESSPAEIRIGSAPFGSTTLPVFAGEIIDSRRLPIPRLVGMPWGGRAHLKVQFPSDRSGSTESLLTFNTGSRIISYSVTYLGGRRLTIASAGPGGAVIESAEVDADLSVAHSINFWPSVPLSAGETFGLSCDFDGRHILGSTSPLVQAVCPVLSSGVDLSRTRAAQTRFSGPELNLTLTSDGTSTGSIMDFGPVHMIATLPPQKTGRQEPIVTTGRTGAGDLIYIVYVDDQHVRIGFDHWSTPAILSDPIAIDYRSPHDIWVVEGSLYPPLADDALWGAVDPAIRKRLANTVTVVLDGKTALSVTKTTYPSTTDEVTFGRNRIGGSTADPDFSGTIHYSERTGTVLPPGLKL